MSYDPKGPIAKILEPLLANELASTYGIADDAQDTAEFINDRIGQGKSANEICADVNDVINIPIDEAFIGRVFDEIARLQQVHASGVPLEQLNQPEQSQQPQPQQPQQVQPPQQLGLEQSTAFAFTAFPTPEVSANPFFPNGAPADTFDGQEQTSKNFPSGPAAKSNNNNNQKKNHVDFNKLGNESRKPNSQKGRASRNGVSKDYDFRSSQRGSSRKSINVANLERTLNLSSDDAVNIQPFTQRPPKGRCPQFPNCTNRDCELAHPAKKCFHYPHCQNPPGTCDYLHPSEDKHLIEEMNKNKARHHDRRNHAPQVELCKFGVLCSKELCPFGHPTPANKHAKVIVQKWCRQNLNCTDEECVYAHSSPNYQAPPPVAKPVPAYVAPSKFSRFPTRVTTTLTQCKFGKACTSALCNKRHATSNVACRAGYNCTRMNCTFAHPVMEECRFGGECKNNPCFFIHPDGRERQLFDQGENIDTSTIGRSFAVPDDQVMEQAVLQ